MSQRLRLLSSISAAIVLLASPALATVDRTTGLEADVSRHVPIPEGTGSIDVLWDLTHGVFLDYEPTGRFSQMAAMITGSGCNLTTTTAGVDNIDLSVYEILVICVASSWDSAYTSAEVIAIQDFSAAGGKILILGDNPDANAQNINPVAQALGTTTGLTDLLPPDLFVDNLAAHPIFNGISQIYMRAAGELATIPPSVPVAWTAANKIAAAVVDPLGAHGCVVTLGDVTFANNNLGAADNLAFLQNVLEWLKTCSPPISVDATTWGRVKSSYRQ